MTRPVAALLVAVSGLSVLAQERDTRPAKTPAAPAPVVSSPRANTATRVVAARGPATSAGVSAAEQTRLVAEYCASCGSETRMDVMDAAAPDHRGQPREQQPQCVSC